jgi:hypothetical protein
MSGRSVLRWINLGSAVCALLMSGSFASAQTSQPSSLEGALKLAPEDVAAVIHVEVKSQMKEVLAGVRKGMEPNSAPQALFQALEGVAPKIDSADIFFVPATEGAPMPLVVLQGSVTPEDLNAALKATGLLPLSMKLEKKADSIYTMGPEEMPIMVLEGGAATGLPKGALVGGPASLLTNEFLPTMGKGKNEAIREMLKDVDTSAPIWMAAQMDRLGPVGDAPKAVTGALYLLGGGSSKLTFEFRDANSADLFAAGFQENAPLAKIVLGSLDMQKDGAKVRFVAKTKDTLVPMLASAAVESMSQARRTAMRAVSMANLRMIGQGAHILAAGNKEQFPADLRTIWKEALGGKEESLRTFVSPVSGKRPKLNDKGEFDFEPDYVYVRYAMTVGKIADSARMILAYERPENYKNEFTVVLYVDGHCAIVKMEEFNKQLKATQDWIAAQETEAKKDK